MEQSRNIYWEIRQKDGAERNLHTWKSYISAGWSSGPDEPSQFEIN